MLFKPLLYSVIAIMFSFNQLIGAKEFCQAFRNNNNSISYVFQWKVGDDIIIDGHNWRLNISLDRNNNLSLDSLSFMDSSRSKLCPLFTEDYSMGVTVQTFTYHWNDWYYGTLILFDKNDWKRVVILYSVYKKLPPELSDHRFIASKTLDFSNGNPPEYPLAVFKYSPEVIVVINGSVSGKRHPHYRIFRDLSVALVDRDSEINKDPAKLTEYQPFFEFESPNKLIGVFPYGRNGSETVKNIQGYVVLLQDRLKLFWCYLNPKNNSTLEKCINSPKLLIDCNQQNQLAPTDDMKPTDIYIAIITIVLIVVFFIGIIFIAVTIYAKKVRAKSTEAVSVSMLKSSVISKGQKSAVNPSKQSKIRTINFSNEFSGKPAVKKPVKKLT